MPIEKWLQTQKQRVVLKRRQATMHHPYLAFCINESGELVKSHQCDPDRQPPLEVEISLAELEGKGREGAARSIGELTLALREIWYPEKFSEYPALK